MPFVKVWIHFVYEESLGFRGSSAKADKKSDCSPLAEASGNLESRGNLGRSGDKRLHGCGYKMPALSGIKSGLCSLNG